MNHSDRFHLYHIRVVGHPDERWFDGVAVAPQSGGETVISGAFDQSALHGLLNRIGDLGLELISVRRDSIQESCPEDRGV